jgi:hypothetical protein
LKGLRQESPQDEEQGTDSMMMMMETAGDLCLV